jgi:hypothetical protein
VDSLVGAWRQVNHFFHREDGKELSNNTPETVGYLIYTADGHVAYQRMRSICAAFANVEENWKRGTPEEKIAAFDNINCYCGTYDVRGNTVVHHVEAASFPNNVGKDLVRTFVLSGDELRVTTVPNAGELRTLTLVFQRSQGT